LFNRFCVDLDHNLREMGVGDLTVPRRMKAYAEAFYGRSEVYGKALAARDRAALSAALARNVFGREEAGDESSRLAGYVFAAASALAAQPADAIMRGYLRFPDPEHPAAVPAES
jgi:cytochrome b pre-mRNA-processing protein 3